VLRWIEEKIFGRKSEESREEFQEAFLLNVEFTLIVVLSCGIVSVSLFLGLWVFLGYGQHEIHVRMFRVLAGADRHWRGTAVAFLPLVYRPIRLFLLRVEKFMGLEAPHPQKAQEETINSVKNVTVQS
jgi:hypothetical protein